MQVCKCGNGLAIRLPAAIIEALKLKEGDEIEVNIAGKQDSKIAHNRSREKALESLRRLAKPLPPGFQFDREELNER